MLYAHFPETGKAPAEYLYRPGPEDTVVPMSTMGNKVPSTVMRSQRNLRPGNLFQRMRYAYLDEHKADLEAAAGVPLTFLPFVAEATIKSIKEFPIFNASALREQIAMKKHVHLGVAVALDKGLILSRARKSKILG